MASSARFADGVTASIDAGMIPDIEVDPSDAPTGCVDDPNASTLCLPDTAAQIDAYVSGFVATARSVLVAHPGARLVFEPMNEPWNWATPPGIPSGRLAADRYAAVLAPLLAAALTSSVPLDDIYVPATGRLDDGTNWIADLYAARPCLAPGGGACGPVRGWNLHPYGLPNSRSEGIGSVPAIRAGMRSGEDNIIISEIGFCARDVNAGADCEENRADVVGTGAQTARWLTQTLHVARAMWRAGWLRGLLVWNRAGGGWAMQDENGSLTPQGEALLHAAEVTPPLVASGP
ncbi:MAG: hypothetical protein WBQ18_19635 [Solirubrobacteraceae bacterium]